MRIVQIKSDPKAREKPCLRCGYSLRKILDARFCPECGLSVWLSLNADDSLDRSSPPWTRRLAVACWIMAGAQVLGVAAMILGVWNDHRLHEIIKMWTPRSRVPSPQVLRATRLRELGCWVAYLWLFSGALYIFASDEGRHPDKWKSYRWICRIAAGFGALVGFYELRSWAVTPYPMIFNGIRTRTLFEIALFGGIIAALAYLRALAKRLPNSRLARFCGILLLAPLVSLLKTVPIFWIIAAVEFARFIDYLPWGYLPLMAALLVRFAVLFQRASKQAEKDWATETAPGADLSKLGN